jgi:hypothetical protein
MAGRFILHIEQEYSVSLWKYCITVKCIFRGNGYAQIKSVAGMAKSGYFTVSAALACIIG